MSTFKKGKRELEQETPSEGLAGKDSMGRRIWDKEYFKDKYEQLQEQPKKLVKGPTESLKDRSGPLNLEDKVNEKRTLTADSSKAQIGGFFCEVCDCHLRDSRAYLDHINGRSHNRMLGMTMNVEKVTVERVIEKIKRIKAGLE